MSLKYDQKKMSASRPCRDFYAKWVKRPDVQQDSEFYRHLLDQAAKWHQAAIQGNAARGRSTAAADHNKWVAGVIKDQVQPAVDAAGYILQIATQYEAAPPGATSLDQVYENSKGWGRVQDVIADGKTDDPYIQNLINQATAAIQKTMGPNWKWNQASVNALFDKADSGYKTLIHGAKSPSEVKQWRTAKNNGDYDGQRVKSAAASARIAKAEEQWQTALDDCAGDAFCARDATKTYRDILQQNAPMLIAGQAGVGKGLEDRAQSSMLIATIGQLNHVVAGDPIDVGGGIMGQAVPGAGSTPKTGDFTQPDAAVGATSPTELIGQIGNLMNKDIKNLDNGGWVSSEPTMTGGANPTQAVDGDGNPAFHLVTHDPGEVPMPGLIPVKGVLTFNDPTRARDAAGGPNDPNPHAPHSVTPTQYVTAQPATIVTVDAGGTVVDPTKAVGRTLVGGKANPAEPGQTAPLAGYSIVRGVVGPDGNPVTLYRTGDGGKTPFLFMTEPPVNTIGTGVKLITDPKTGAKVPVLTSQATTGPDGKPEMTYDLTPLSDGIKHATTQLNSTNYPLGTFQTIGAASTATAINRLFAKGNTPDAIAKSNQMLAQFQRNVASLPATDPDRINSVKDLNQLTQTVNLHAGGKFGQTVDDNYTTINDRTPAQLGYQNQLEANGIAEGKNGVDRDEVGRRIQLLDEIDQADKRIAARGTPFGLPTNPFDPYNVGGAVNAQDRAALALAKKDIFNPTISVSNIKIPGFDPLMQNLTPEDLARQAGIAAGLSTVGGAAPKFPTAVPYKAPAPPAPTVSQGPPAGRNADATTPPSIPKPPTPPPPGPQNLPNVLPPPPSDVPFLMNTPKLTGTHPGGGGPQEY